MHFDGRNVAACDAVAKGDARVRERAGIEDDSGSGVFVWDSSENKWKIAGVTLAVGSNTGIDTSTIGYYEESGKDSPKTCCTYFADLSQYAPQINAIMAIPEPSAFGLLAGTCALALAASRRRRSRPLPLR